MKTNDNGYPTTNGCPVCDQGDGRVHKGPHDARYHRNVLERLTKAVGDANKSMPPGLDLSKQQAWRKKFVDQLFNDICRELNTVGSKMRDWVTAAK